MIQNFRGKKSRDTEALQDSIIDNTVFSSNGTGRNNSTNKLNISSQHFAYDNFDNYIEKRNKES